MRRFLLFLFIASGLLLLILGLFLKSAQVEAQEAFEDDQYVGAEECLACHRNLRAYLETDHGLTLQNTADNPDFILADFTQSEDLRTVQFPGEDTPRPFTADDITYVQGTGDHTQVYLYQAGENDYRVFPAVWSTEESRWIRDLPLDADWMETAGLDWEDNCIGCHVTGLDVETMTWVDSGILCEACHGPGGAHVNMANNLPRRADEADIQALRDLIVVSPDPQICGQCHSRGKDIATEYPYPVGYRPGDNLLGVFALIEQVDPVHWWQTGHARNSAMQFNEWFNSGHATAHTTMQSSSAAQPACMTCHSADYQFTENIRARHESGDWEGIPPESVTVEGAQFGVACSVCHNPHSEAEYQFLLVDEPLNLCQGCHINTPPELFTIHHPSTEMFTGVSLVPGMEGTPSVHAMAEEGPNCITCHMLRIPAGGGLRVTHALSPVQPGAAEEGEGNPCSTCHTDLLPTDLQLLIDGTQDSVLSRLSTAWSRIGSIDEATAASSDSYDQVVAALSFVQGDGSMGVHNYQFVDELLDFSEVTLSEISSRAPAHPTEAPAPTSVSSAILPTYTAEVHDNGGIRPTTLLVLGIMLVIILISAAALFRFGRGSANHA